MAESLEAEKDGLKIVHVPIENLKPSEYNPRKASEKEAKDLMESVKRFGIVDPIIANSSTERKNIVIGGHFRLRIAKDLGYKEVPVVYVSIPDIKREQELNLRLNRNLGEWDFDLLADFDETLLLDVGFEQDELKNIFEPEIANAEQVERIEPFMGVIAVLKIPDGDFGSVKNELEEYAGKHRFEIEFA